MPIPKDLGITCLNCGQIQMPPNKDSMDNWSCGYCHSGIISIRMLRNVAPQDLVAQFENRKRSKQAMTTGRPCAICKHQMELITVVFHEKIPNVEMCHNCRILWFDSGELMRALRYRSPENAMHDDEGNPLEEVYYPAPPKEPSRELHGPEISVDDTISPLLTYGIIFICAVLLPATMHYPDLTARFGFDPSRPLRMFGGTWVTSLFLHEGAAHLLRNLVMLFMVGGYLERSLGHDRFLRLFLLSGAMGPAAYLLLGTKPDSLVVGMSSAVCGLVTYFILRFPFSRTSTWVGETKIGNVRQLVHGGLTGATVLTVYMSVNVAGFLLHPHAAPTPGDVNVQRETSGASEAIISVADGGGMVENLFVGSLAAKFFEESARTTLFAALAGAIAAFLWRLVGDVPQPIPQRVRRR